MGITKKYLGEIWKRSKEEETVEGEEKMEHNYYRKSLRNKIKKKKD